MTNLEFLYRLLLRSYPPHHRATYEDEMLSTLLDVATPGQQRPKFREAAAIITTGLSCRVQDGSAVKPGLGLAGVVALVATFALSTMAIVVAAQRPLTIGLVPVMAWLAVVAASIVGAWARSAFRMIPAATVALAMIAAGSSAMGLRRSTVIPAALFLILSACSHPARRSVRLAASAVGIVLGAALGAAVAADLNNVFQNADSPWVYVAQWDLVSDLVPANAPLLVAVCALAAAAATLGRQPRYAVAAAVVAVPFIPGALFGHRGLMPYVLPLNNLVLLSIVAATLTLGITLSMSWQSHRRMRHANSD